MSRAVLLRLREAGNLLTCASDIEVKPGEHVVVEADRGLDYGEVLEVEREEDTSQTKLKKIIRKATPQDEKQIKEGRQKAKESMKTCARKIKELELSMKLVSAEYSFDQKKVIFYFTSEGRIDFRDLVKDLAKIFKVRIEMRQIGVRDEARLFGGVGPCGRTLCCCSFLKSFEPVTIKMAKLQRLSLNPQKISGMCGRLMCCLFYEYRCYKEYIKGLPKDGQVVDTPKGKGKVITVNVLKRIAYVELESGVIEKVYFKADE